MAFVDVLDRKLRIEQLISSNQIKNYKFTDVGVGIASLPHQAKNPIKMLLCLSPLNGISEKEATKSTFFSAQKALYAKAFLSTPYTFGSALSLSLPIESLKRACENIIKDPLFSIVDEDKSSTATAWGLFRAIQAVFYKTDQKTCLTGAKIALQGLDALGEKLAYFLHLAGAHLIITDTRWEVVKKLAALKNVQFTAPDEISKTPCDIFVVTRTFAPIDTNSLHCKALIAASVQLLDFDPQNILFIPAFMALLGESAYYFYEGDEVRTKAETDKIFDHFISIFSLAEKRGVSFKQAADALVCHLLKYPKE